MKTEACRYVVPQGSPDLFGLSLDVLLFTLQCALKKGSVIA